MLPQKLGFVRVDLRYSLLQKEVIHHFNRVYIDYDVRKTMLHFMENKYAFSADIQKFHNSIYLDKLILNGYKANLTSAKLKLT